MRVVFSAGQMGFTEDLIDILDRKRVTKSGGKRVFILARPYNTSKRMKDALDSPAKEQALASIESIRDGSAYPVEYVCMYVWSSHIAEYGSTG